MTRRGEKTDHRYVTTYIHSRLSFFFFGYTDCLPFLFSIFLYSPFFLLPVVIVIGLSSPGNRRNTYLGVRIPRAVVATNHYFCPWLTTGVQGTRDAEFFWSAINRDHRSYDR
jgi:hypothetical protein